MSTFADVAHKASEDSTFLGALAADPEKALKAANITLTDDADVRKTELFALTAQQNILAAARVVEIDAAPIERYGIGAGCCNHATLLP